MKKASLGPAVPAEEKVNESRLCGGVTVMTHLEIWFCDTVPASVSG